ncbi:MAG: hypothetical protein NC039_07965 [Muribaculaceae bacterium]|nr:hypothetical protein [Muribaculaceae bacterium]
MSAIGRLIRHLDNKDKLIFVVGLLSYIKFRVLGTFACAEILIFLSTPFIPFKAFTRNKEVRTFFLLAGLWLLGVLLADIYNDSPLTERLKGTFNVMFLMMLIPFAYWILYDKPQRMLFYVLGAGISGVLSFHFQGTAYEADNEIANIMWGYYAMQYLTVAIAAWLYYAGHRKAGCIVIMAFGILGLFNLSRNVFLLYTIDTIIILVIGKVVESNKWRSKLKMAKRFIPLLLLLVIAFMGVKAVYSDLAASGTLGERAKEKYEDQAGRKLGLVSARSDFFVALYSITESPIFGYGSYAKDTGHFNQRFYNMIGQDLHMNRVPDTTEKLMQGHSYILGAWVYSGILGCIFWVWVLFMLLKFIHKALFLYPNLLLLNITLLSMLLWDIFFSPFKDRMVVLMDLTFILIQLYAYRKYTRQDKLNLNNNTLVQSGRVY